MNISNRSEKIYKSPWFLIIAFGTLLRLPYLFHILQDIDEGVYAAFASALNNGNLPYLEIVDHKFPAIYYLYALIFKISGDYNMGAIHVFTLVYTTFTGYWLYKTARLIGKENAGLWSVFFFISFSALYPQNLAANNEIFMTLPCILSIYYIIQGTRLEQVKLFLLSGFMASIAMMFKQVGGIQLGVIGLYIIINSWDLVINLKWKAPVVQILYILIGFLAPFLLMILYFIHIGVLTDFLFWTLIDIGSYLESGSSNLTFWYGFIAFFIPYCLACYIIWKYGMYWLLKSYKNKRNHILRSTQSHQYWLLLIWLVFSILPCFLGSRLYPHYYIQFLPPLCLLGGLGVSLKAKTDQFNKRGILMATILPSLFSLMIGIPMEYSTPPSLWKPKPDFRPVTNYIKRNTDVTDKIFVWGWFTPLYVYSKRTPSSRFLLTNMLVNYKAEMLQNEDFKLIVDAAITWRERKEAWPLLKNDLERNPPALILDTSPGNYNKFGNFPLTQFSILCNIVQSKYVMDTLINGIGVYKLKRELSEIDLKEIEQIDIMSIKDASKIE